MATNTDKHWETYGREDPYFGVLTLEQYRAGKISEAALEQFFQSGRDHVESVLSVIRERLAPGFAPTRALDFGCGVGRIVVPLASLCESVIGVDVSPSMLEKARAHCEGLGISNVEFVLSDDGLSRVDGSFDFVHSYIVFQHIAPRRGKRLLRAMLSHLAEGGVGALHFTFHRTLPRFRRLVNWMQRSVPLAHHLLNLLRGRSWSRPHMAMHPYPLSDLLRILHADSCRKVFVEFTDHSGDLGVFLFFQKSGPGQEAAPHLSFDHLKPV